MADTSKQAHGIAALGRGNDSMLVHMTPGEVAGLQSLAMRHGGSLTRNPKTGLVEAGFLESILPMVLGGATMAFTGSPWGAALAGGLGGYATSGGKLTGAALGALGGYGGAGLYSGISGLGASAAGLDAVGGQAGLSSILSTPTLPGEFGTLAEVAPPAVQNAQAAQQIAQASQFPDGLSQYQAAQPPMPAAQVPQQLPQAQMPPTTTPMPQGDNFTRGLGEFVKDPSALYKPGDTWNKDAIKNTGMAAAPFLSWALDANGRPVQAPSGATGSAPGMMRPYGYSQTLNPGWGQPGQAYFNQSFTASAPYQAAAGGQVPAMAGGGIASLGHYSDGGRLLQGPGDGLSDNIPATINGKQPAALADGEFVVSSDVVSGLGGGSTKAGAKKLYDMMDRVRQQAHGTKKQIKPVSAKALPA